VSTGPQLVQPEAAKERNWVPLVVAAAVVLAVGVGLVLMLERGKSAPKVTPISAPLDPYAGNLEISNLHMSESANLAGGKSTFVDGSITNTGNMTVTAISVQVLFRDPAHEVAQNETQPLKVVRTREPYIDVEPVSASPLKPGDTEDFRLVFDTVAADWDGVFPEIRVIQVEGKQGTVQ
jgi:negative regulator of sigma E activity